MILMVRGFSIFEIIYHILKLLKCDQLRASTTIYISRLL